MTLQTTADLKAYAISRSLFAPISLDATIARLGFIQADPIRSPARAQDLILRHRASDYHAGDLEKHYASLDIEEDVLYAYGFFHRPVWDYLHPRQHRKLTPLESDILTAVRQAGTIHPRNLDAQFGRDRVINAWGGHSGATKRALEALHHQGLLRIIRRDKGVRVYAPAAPPTNPTPAKARLQELTLVAAGILAPIAESTLKPVIAYLRRKLPEPETTTTTLADLLAAGRLTKHVVDGVIYLTTGGEGAVAETDPTVRFLAPFDPVVWDRKRFEHLWGWPYRFEAYVPAAKRIRGYYAMPLLYGQEIIGWANLSFKSGQLTAELGFIGPRPREASFRHAVEEETQRMQNFLVS